MRQFHGSGIGCNIAFPGGRAGRATRASEPCPWHRAAHGIARQEVDEDPLARMLVAREAALDERQHVSRARRRARSGDDEGDRDLEPRRSSRPTTAGATATIHPKFVSHHRSPVCMTTTVRPGGTMPMLGRKSGPQLRTDNGDRTKCAWDRADR